MSTSSATRRIKLRLKQRIPVIKRLQGITFPDADGVVRRAVVAVGLDANKERLGAVLLVEPDWCPNGVAPSFIAFRARAKGQGHANMDQLCERIIDSCLPATGKSTLMWRWFKHEKSAFRA